MEQPNINYINELSGNDEDFKQKMISIVKSELPQEIESYNSLFKLQNFNATAEMVHKLKHKISVLGLEKSYYIAEKFEENLKQSSAELKEEFDNILQTMQNFVDHL
ncbi:Hpt domain-containing protein [uncultured Flavobacterium sp.]|uniref:Hpt domain-containing protein n=1 Tax=uncultured Flavobacterium sp. TaxID=165435 RepID=UPI0030C7D52D